MWTKTFHRFATCAVLVCGLVGSGGGAEVGLFSDAQCTSCRLEIGAGESREFFVRFLTDGLPAEQFMTSVGLRIVGLPAQWTAVVVPNPDAPVAIGSLFGPGANIAFSSAQGQPGSLLYSVTLDAPANASDMTDGFVLQVQSPDPPVNPGFSCPWISVVCSQRPCDIMYCVGGGRLFVNTPGECTVETADQHWSSIKALYR